MATCPTCRTKYADDVTTCATDGAALLPDEAFKGVDNDLVAGDVVGEYRVENKLGQGGFGAVYKAVHPLIGKAAAVKVLGREFSSKPDMVGRFIAEARAVNQIRHRGIIDIFAFGSLPDGRQYYVMELLEGITLDGFMKSKGHLSLAEAVPILRGIARAIDAAHATGIAHRDLKPENVFLTFDDERRPIPKILDFGIAKLLGETSGASKTRTGTPMGTPHYMSPEQSRGVGVDNRTDIYSFGVMAYEMLTGKVPFDGEAVMDILLKQITEMAAPPSSIRQELPPEVDAAILRMMEKDASQRPTTLSSGVEEIAAAAGMPSSVSPSTDAATPSTGPKLSAGEVQKLSEAKTLAQGPQTLTGAANEIAPLPRRRTWLIATAGLALVLGAVGAWAGLRNPKVATSTAPSVTTPMGALPPPSSPASAPVLAPIATQVMITVESTPVAADVFRGADRVAAAGSPFALNRGDEAVTLTIKAKGFQPKDVTVTPRSDEVVTVTLDKAAGTNVGKTKNKELENPFGP